MHILVGDIGGTHTRLAHYRADAAHTLSLLAESTLSSDSAESFPQLLSDYLSHQGEAHFDRACFGVAGPVVDQTCETTNLPWRLSARELEQEFGFPRVWLLNDLEANAWSIDGLEESDFHLLNPGAPHAQGNRLIISAGTGLGEAGLFWDGERHHPFASEGGHADFSPANAQEFALHQWLAQRYAHVSWERLVSGPGLENLYDFLLYSQQQHPPEWLNELMQRQGRAPAISNAGLSGQDELCSQTLDLFLDLFGREAGNHALKLMARGGVYLGGGIPPKILSRLKSGPFLQAFFNKGRMRPLMEAMPVRVILNDRSALLGSARYAMLQSPNAT